MKTTHTPGPITLKQDTFETHACIPTDSPDKLRHVATFRNHADAVLFAAAPDLLAALQELCADKYLADPINADRMKNARAAIARATA